VVRLHKTGEAEAGSNGTNETGEWITLVPSNHTTFDLTKLRVGNMNMTTIVNESVETGKYTQVRLIIVESAKGKLGVEM